MTTKLTGVAPSVVAFLALAADFVALDLRSLAGASIVDFPGDSAWFEAAARVPLDRLSFWAGSRPWGYSLLLKPFPGDHETIAHAQILLHLLSHLYLAAVLFWALGSRIAGLCASAAVLLFALSPYVNSWAIAIIAESLSFSATAALLGSSVLFAERLSNRSASSRSTAVVAAGLVVCAAVLSGTRDPWPYFLPVLAAWIALPLARRGASSRSRAGIRVGTAVALVAVFALQLASARMGDRWRIGLTNVILQRVLPDEEVRTEWVESYGLPLDRDLLSLADKYEHEQDWAARRHAAFQGWLGDAGVGSYLRYVIAHPLRIATEVRRSQRLTINEFSFEYTNAGNGTAAARWIARVVFFPLPGPPDFYLFVPIVVLVWLAARARPPIATVAQPVLAFGMFLPFLSAFCYLTDTNEVYQHSLPVTFGVRLVWMLSIVLAVAEIVGRRGQPDPGRLGG